MNFKIKLITIIFFIISNNVYCRIGFNKEWSFENPPWGIGCDTVNTQTDMNICSFQSYQIANVVLDSTYKQLILYCDTIFNYELNNLNLKESDLVESKKRFKKQRNLLEMSNNLFKGYRDSLLGVISNLYEGGTIRPLIVNKYGLEITINQIKTLSNIIHDFKIFDSQDWFEKNIKERLLFEKGKKEMFIIGDINNDKSIDTAYIYTPPIYYYQTKIDGDSMFDSCLDNNCYNSISFTCNLPQIYRENSLWGKVENIGDLNEDGYCEIVFQSNWFIGSRVGIYIYSFNGKVWNLLHANYMDPLDSYKNRFKEINKREFEYLEEIWDTDEGITKDVKRIIKFNN